MIPHLAYIWVVITSRQTGSTPFFVSGNAQDKNVITRSILLEKVCQLGHIPECFVYNINDLTTLAFVLQVKPYTYNIAMGFYIILSILCKI